MAVITRVTKLAVVLALLLFAYGTGWFMGRTGVGVGIDTVALDDREREFTDHMRATSLVGFYTTDGREARSASPDRYDIESVEKIDDERWRFNVRMHHDDSSVLMPILVPMRWLGDTPMVMLTDYTIPLMGTFSARVFFHGDRYAGTWQHGAVGGLMYGRIERQATASR